MSTRSDDCLLRWTLRANAAFSLVCAALASTGAEPLARILGIGEPLALPALGAQLAVWAALLLLLASRPRIRIGLALAVVAADVLWVLGTVPVVLAADLTRTGFWTALAIGDIVAVFAALQLLGIRRVRAGIAPLAA